jgi:DNA-binding XRE family transcriptional regulator
MNEKNSYSNGGIYRALRKSVQLSQEEASEQSGIPRNSLVEIESDNDGKHKEPGTEDIVSLSKIYHSKRLCHWYCSSVCPVGREINLLEIEPLETEDFGHTMMTIHSAIRNLKSLDLDELIDIAKDGKIEKDEKETYTKIKDSLAELAKSYGALLRIEEDDVDGQIIYRENFEIFYGRD